MIYIFIQRRTCNFYSECHKILIIIVDNNELFMCNIGNPMLFFYLSSNLSRIYEYYIVTDQKIIKYVLFYVIINVKWKNSFRFFAGLNNHLTKNMGNILTICKKITLDFLCDIPGIHVVFIEYLKSSRVQIPANDIHFFI